MFLLPLLHTDCINHVIYSPVAIHSFATDLLTSGGEVVDRLKSFLTATPCEDPDRRRIEIHSSKISVDGINGAHDRRTPSYHRHIPLGCRRQRIEQHTNAISFAAAAPTSSASPASAPLCCQHRFFYQMRHAIVTFGLILRWGGRRGQSSQQRTRPFSQAGFTAGSQRERNTRVKEKPPRRSSGREGPRETVSSSALHHSARAREALVKGTTEVNGRWVKGDIGLRAETSERQRSKSFCTSGGRTG